MASRKGKRKATRKATRKAKPGPAIRIEGARQHNLRGVEVEIPRGALVAFTGVSGSGKTSLAIETLFAEGRRRYVESLSARARAALGQLERPEYDAIHGLTPTIAIEQRAARGGPRATVGTMAEIDPLLRLAWARAGVQHCTQCGAAVERASAGVIAQRLADLPERTRFQLLAPIARGVVGDLAEALDAAQRDGFVRARIDGEVVALTPGMALDPAVAHDVELVVDRLVARPGAEARIAGSVETSLAASGGEVWVLFDDRLERFAESLVCPECRLTFEELTPARMSVNSPRGMCPACKGLGRRRALDPRRWVDADRPVAKGAVRPWAEACRSRTSWERRWLEAACRLLSLPLDVPWSALDDAGRRALVEGPDGPATMTLKEGRRAKEVAFGGLAAALEQRWREGPPEVRAALEEYADELPCGVCEGARLRPESRAVRLGGVALETVLGAPASRARALLSSVLASLEGAAEVVAGGPLSRAMARVELLEQLGMPYLALARPAPTLSGGEAQRIRLAGQLGGELAGVTYVLDEPTSGLHARDGARLVESLRQLRDLGNTVVVVEHDPAAIAAADQVVDFGPGAGVEGGQVLYAGPPSGLPETTLTGAYLSGARQVPRPASRRPVVDVLTVRGARANNLKGVDVAIPLGRLVAVTGVSGAGKSSLVGGVLVPVVARRLGLKAARPGAHDGVEGIERIDRLVEVDRAPIGRSPRSNPATYCGVFDEVRRVFSQQKESRIQGYGVGRFSFNRKGGRCEACAGEGYVRVEMDFLPDVLVRCEVCDGARYNAATLRVRYRGYTIAEVLAMTVAEAVPVFENQLAIAGKLELLEAVGLGYLPLGQPASTLSGGEAQRLKLVRELDRRDGAGTLVVLDEPTTGLHPHDVARLVVVLQRLVDGGASVVVVEHHLDLVACVDHVVDLGPEGGEAGGEVVVCGTPEEVAGCAASHTGRHLAGVLCRGEGV